MPKNYLLLLFFLCFTFFSSAQQTRGFYVNDFKNIIGDTQKENELLAFAQNEGFNYLLLYNLYYIHNNLFNITDPVTSTPLSSFIHRAKTDYGIIQVGAVGETSQSFDNIDQYNQLQINHPTQLIDIYNIEFEVWNSSLINSYYCGAYLDEFGYPCTKNGAFDFFIGELIAIHDLTQLRGLITEAYIGLPTAAQSQLIGVNSDRVLVHYYRKSDVYKNGNSIYNYKSYRLPDLAPSTGVLNVMPVFSSRSYAMGPWLVDHPETQAFDTYINGQNAYNDATGSWKDHIHLEGYQWYRYTDLTYYINLGRKPIDLAPPAVDQLHKASNLKSFSIYPNPSTNEINIKKTFPAEVNVQLINHMGHIVRSTQFGPNQQMQWSVQNLPNGIYILLFNWEGQTESQRILIQHTNQ